MIPSPQFQLARLTTALAYILGVRAAPQVSLGKTVITGLRVGETEFFGGLPFALPPIGDLRFAPPVLITSLNASTFDATSFGPACLQPIIPGGLPSLFSEDCLTLNIVRPAGLDATSKLPVMVWIHGGGFEFGFPAQFNGTSLVSRSVERGTPIIYVSIAYRLGSFGFPFGGVEVAKKGASNLGHRDQIAALQWIQANIESFGGDKSKVTLFGESAGAVSVGNLYFNSKLETLVRAAILESGSGGTGAPPGGSSWDARWKSLAGSVAACSGADLDDTFTCLRKAPAQDILDAQGPWAGQLAFLPVVDGPGGIIPDRVSVLIESGKLSRIPFLIGTNLDEGTLLIPDAINSTAAARTFLEDQTRGIANDATAQNDLIDKVLTLYPDDPAQGSPFGTGNNTFGRSAAWKRVSAIYGDILFHAPRRQWTSDSSKLGVKNFVYYFADPQPGDLGVTHATELPYVFGPIVGTNPPSTITTLGPVVMDYWISFATSLDPNDGKGSTRPNWPSFDPALPTILQLKTDNITTISDDYRKGQISLILDNPIAFGR